ncbi:MAG TPA: sugar ABC transporter substrate-binding protein [Candidatus Bathyarchaeia archaeon]|nr:sugar ABC transporter substrate-binding protein [Candidatus Bathyarchaeia archaeon]
MRCWAWTVVVVTLGACLAARGEPLVLDPPMVPGELDGEIEVWSWNIAAASLENLIPMFNEVYPRCRVRVNMNGTNMQSRFLLSLAAGVGAPDVMQLQVRETPRYSMTGKLTDLTQVAKKYEQDFPPSFWQDCTHDGRVYGIPWDIGPGGVFYKRSVFEQYGVDPLEIETWDDYIAAGETILERSGGKTKMLCVPRGMLVDLFEPLLQQAGGQIFDKEGRVAVNSRESLQVLRIIRRMIETGVGANIIHWTHEFLASLKSPVVATYPVGAWFGGTIRDYAPETSGDWGVFRLPAMEPGGLRTTNFGGSSLVIPDQCRNKEAAWRFIEFALCTKKAQIEQFRAFELYPALLTTHSDPFFDEPEPFYGGQKTRRQFSLDINKIPIMYRSSNLMEAERYINQTFSRWVNDGMKEPEGMLAQLEEKMNRRLGCGISPSSLSLSRGN